MMRISLESPALIAVRKLLSGSQPTQRGRNRSRKASGPTLRTEQLEPRTMLDAGMRAFLADLGTESDTGASTVDNLTYDQTPTLSGSVQGAVSEVRLRIDGVRVATLPVTNGKWTYTVPAEEALPAGKHKIAVLPLDASGKAGTLSKPLSFTIRTATPTAPTLQLGTQSDTGAKGDGKTTYDTPMIRGIAQPGRLVNVAIDGVFAGQVKSDAKNGTWTFKSPQLANGLHDITATAETRAGLKSAATSFAVTVNGKRTVMLDASSGQTVELMASHLLGQGSQGFVVTKVHGGTLQKWLPAQNAWKTIPAGAAVAANVLKQTTLPIRNISFTDIVRWTPSGNARGTMAAFEITPLDKAGGATAPAPQAGTVPGNVVDAVIGGYKESLGTTISWKDPVDGGGQNTRYSVEVTREDGKTLLYNVPRTVHGVASVEGGAVIRSRIWGATKTGAGEARSQAQSASPVPVFTNVHLNPTSQTVNYSASQAQLSYGDDWSFEMPSRDVWNNQIYNFTGPSTATSGTDRLVVVLTIPQGPVVAGFSTTPTGTYSFQFTNSTTSAVYTINFTVTS